MKTLTISTSNQSIHLSIFSSWKPRFSAFNPRTAKKLNYPLSTFKPHANAKGFSSRPSTSLENDVTNKKKTNKGKKNEDDEIPQEVFNKMIVRILVSVLVPMGSGLAILYVLGELKEQHVWDFPMWVPFSTTLLTFGASALGIVYGTLSTSLDVEKEGTFLGLNEVQKNWEEMWQEEDNEASQR
ncbi:hypothetical protein Lal_00035033 [Lupinus albus]|uniref:Uncharacterized protein n=1 Tax=Lupinus albus TaxID=3870 RepID=A0A6A5PKZ9_LUPAL|nr:hypothetical protein Lalb_Chr03g0034941 [Lupinus albus]KAF1897330.1 hypothetical protein Lal_00035033 [Lupinus albus]